MKKILSLLILSFGLNAQTIPFTLMQKGTANGQIPITTGTNNVMTYTATLPSSAIPTLTAYVPYTGATSSVNLGANSFSVGAQSTLNTLYVPSTATVNGDLQLNSRVALGSTAAGAASFRLSRTHTGGVITHGFYCQGEVQSDVTNTAFGFRTGMTLNAATTTGLITHFANQNAGGGTITTQYGYDCADLFSGTTNYGFYSRMTSGANKFAFYGAGTAISYLGGNLGIGEVAPDAYLRIKAGTATAGTSPLKLSAGTVLTTPEACAIETDSGGNLYYSPSSSRYNVALGVKQGAVSGSNYTNSGSSSSYSNVFSLAIGANETWSFHVRLFGKCSTASGTSIKISATSSSNIRGFVNGMNSAVTNRTGFTLTGTTSAGDNGAVWASAGTDLWMDVEFTVTGGGSADTINIGAANWGAGATTTIYIGSFYTAVRVN